MVRYIKRHSLQTRITHDSFVIACILLFISGLFIFIPPLASAIPAGTLFVIRIIHRVIGFIFIAIPIISAIKSPKGFKSFLKHYFHRWDDDDVVWFKRFIPYMLSPKKVHMPAQHEMKSGQVVADGALILGALAMGISGVLMVIGTGGAAFAPALMLVIRLVHNIAFIWLAIFAIAHIFLGAGIFQPYRRTRRLMFGDGKVSESDALYHWGYWAAEELEKGENVVEEDE